MATTSELDIIINAQNKASGEIKKINKEISGIKKNYKKTSKDIQKESKKISSSFSGLGKVVAGAFATKVAFDFGKKMLNVGTQIDQLNKKANIVLGEFRGTVEKTAKDVSKSMGLTNNEFLSAVTNMTDLLVPMKFTREESVKMATETTKLAGALSEWSGGQYDAVQASEILAKAMLGETEQLKAMGIKIDQSSKAFNARIKVMMEDKNITLEQAKALDIQRQIFEKSTDAQEAFKNGASSLIRTQNELKATINGVKEEMAIAFIPVANDLFKAIQPIVEETSKWSSETLGNKKVQEGLVSVLNVVITTFKFILQFIGKVIEGYWLLGEELGVLLGEGYKLRIKYKNDILGVWESIKNGISNIINSIMEKINWLIDKATSALNKIKGIFSSITSIGKKIGSKVSDTAKSVGGGIKSGISSAGNAIGSLFREKGGPVQQNTPYIVGEKGPELFIPNQSGNIKSNKDIMSRNGDININLGGVTVQNTADENRLVDKIKQALIQESRNFNIGIT